MIYLSIQIIGWKLFVMEYLFSAKIANIWAGKLQKYFKSYTESAYQFDQDREIHKAALLEKNHISSATEHF